MADCEYQIGGQGKFYSESEFKKLLSEGYLDKVMLENQVKIKGVKPNEELAKSFQLPSAIQAQVPIESKDNYKVAQEVTAEVSKENPDASVLLTPKGEDLSLTPVYVSEENRGKGIGTKVLESVKKQADKLGKKIVLDTTAELDEETDLGRLENFYQNNGFTKVGENKFEYNPTTEVKQKNIKVYHGGNVQELTNIDKSNPLFVSEDESQAEEYTKENEGNVSEFDINQNAIAEEEKAFNTINKLGLKPKEEGWNVDELNLFELLDPRFETSLSEDDINKFYNELEKEGFGGIKFTDTNLKTGKQDIQNIVIFNPNLVKPLKTTPTETVTKTEEKVTEPISEDEQIETTAKELEGMDIESLFEKTNNKKYFRGQPTEELPQKDIFISPNEIVGKMYTKGKGVLKKLTLKTSNLFDIDTKVTKELNDKLIESWKKNVPKDILIPKEIIKGEYIGDNYSQELKENEQFRRALEGVGYDGLLNNFTRLKLKSPKQEIIVFDKSNLSEINSNVISSAYHKAKQDGSNPELVKSVEELLGKKEPTAEKVTPEAKQKRIETATKNFAEFLRGAKIEEGSARSTIIPIPPKLWNKAVDIIADSVQSGGVSLGKFSDFLDTSIKKIKDSDLFKSLTPKEKGSFTRNIRKELSKYAAEQFNLTFEQADIRGAEFTDLNNELEAAKTTKPTDRQFETLKNKAKKFVERNLPDDVYNKSEVIKEINNNFDKVKTVAGIQKALERENKRIENKEFKIETAEAKQAEKERKATIKEIINLTKPTSPKMISKNRRTGVKKANVSLDALRKINEMRDQGLFDKDNLESKTKEELDALKEQIQNIQAKGRAEKKAETKGKKEIKKSSEALILETLDKPNATLNSEEEILDFMERRNGVVVVDGQVMSKSAFKEFAKENEGKDYIGTKFYINKDIDLKEQKEEKKGVLKTARKYTMAAIRDLDTYMKDIGKGSAELRQWTKENILEPTKKAIYNKVKNTAKFKGEYRDAVKNIFGGFNSAIDYLSKDSGISTDVSDLEGVKPKKLNRDQVVHIYGLINNPDAKKAEKNIERLKSKNHIDTDKVKALVEGDPKLMDYYNFLREMYDKKFREEFGSTIENLYGIPLDKGYYWPEPAGVSENLELNLEGFSNKELSMIAPNMRQRDPKYNGPFELANSYDVYNRYVESMVHAKEFIPIIENSRVLLSDVNRPRVLDKLNDTNKYNDLIDLMRVVFTDKTPYKNNDMDFLANATAIKTLWLRLKAIPQQASAFLNYYNAGWVDGINPAQIIASVVPKNATEIDFALDFYRDNPYLWERLKGASNQDMKAIESQIETITNELGKKVIDKAVFAALSPIKGGDFLATSTPFGGGAFAMAQFKKRLKDNGGDYQDAKDFALQRWFEETERTQQPAIDKSIVSTATYNPMYRFLVPFVSAQNSMGKKIVKAAKDIQDWKNLTKQEKNQAVADMLYYTVVGSIPFSLMSGSLLTVLDVFDEEDEEARGNMFDRLSFDLLADNVMSNIQSLYLVGFATNIVLNEMRGREYFNERPQGETINSFAKFVSSFAMASSDWDFLTEDMKKDYFNRFKLKGKELEEFNALPEDEKIDYLRKNAVETGIISNDEESIRKFKEEYSNKWRFNRMGKEGMDSFLKLFGIDKPMNLYRDITNFIDKNGTFEELIYGEGAGTTEEAEPFSKNVPKQFFDAISYKKDNQLFKMYSDVLGEPEEYYDIYPSKPGGPISNPVSEPDVNQSEKEVEGVIIKRRRPRIKGIQYGD